MRRLRLKILSRVTSCGVPCFRRPDTPHPYTSNPHISTRLSELMQSTILLCREGVNPRAAAIHVAHRYHGARSHPVGRSRWVQLEGVGESVVSRILRECSALFECEERQLCQVKLRAMGGVQSRGSEVMPWGVRAVRPGVGAASMVDRSRLARSVDVFIFDTGVNAHPDMNLVSRRSFVRWERDARDLNGHGSAVASLVGARLGNRVGVVGVAPGVRIHSYKVLDRNGNGDLADAVAAIDAMIWWKRQLRRKYVLANFSLSGYVGTRAYNELDRAVVRAVRAGIVCVCASGNEGQDAGLCTPGHVREAITVGAHDRHRRTASFSNTGAVVDVFAPGVGVETLNWGRASGTSFACPLVCGAAAVLYASAVPRNPPPPNRMEARLVQLARRNRGGVRL